MQQRKLILAVAGALALGASAVANAQMNDSGLPTLWGWDDSSTPATRPQSWIPYTSYGYVGVGAGWSKFDLGSCAPGLYCDDTDTGFKIFTGGLFSRAFGVEAGYVNLGKGAANGGDIKAQGLNVSLIGNLPIGDAFNVYGKVGGLWGFTKTETAIAGGPSGHEQGFNISYGAGVRFDLNRNWAVQGDWDHYRFDYVSGNDDAQLYSLNLVYKF